MSYQPKIANLVGFLAENHHALQQRTASADTLRIADEFILILQRDIADATTLLGELLQVYPHDETGLEPDVVAKTAQALRLLGDLGRFVCQESELVECGLDQLENGQHAA
ncbi:hypothetical protein [Chromobacterium violaceum]|uniref:hypothetical protein n=1 Tax=Chromobacterium violaceum TaxID=536 RepID=UPI003DA9D2A5